MMRPRPILVPLLLLAACTPAAEPTVTPPAAPPPAPVPAPLGLDYRGPPLRAMLRADSGLRIAVQVPTGGFALSADEVTRADSVATVRCTLTAPGGDEVVTQAAGEVVLEIPGPELRGGGALLGVRVAVAEMERGAHYLVAPPHRLAAVVPVPE